MTLEKHSSENPPPSTEQERQRRLLIQHCHVVRQIARCHGVALADVDDVLQRVLLTVLGKVGQIRPGSERAFVVAVARYEAAHMRRTYYRRSELAEEAIPPRSSGQPRLDDWLHRRVMLSRVNAVLAEMDPKFCEVLVQSTIDGWSCERIARHAGVPVGTVKTRLRSARRELRRRMQVSGVDGPSSENAPAWKETLRGSPHLSRLSSGRVPKRQI